MTGFKLTGFAPKIHIKGHYEASGKLLLVPVTGSGIGQVKYCECKH